LIHLLHELVVTTEGKTTHTFGEVTQHLLQADDAANESPGNSVEFNRHPAQEAETLTQV
jgi:hypothetical protein